MTAEQVLVPMPAKDLGCHRWVVQATYTLTGGQAAALAGEAAVAFGEQIVGLDMGCIDCGRTFMAARLIECDGLDGWGPQ